MKKTIVYLFLVFYTLVSCQNPVPKEFTFSPTAAKQYHLKLSSTAANINYKVTCTFEKENNNIVMSTTINEIQNIGDSEMDNEINQEYQNHVNSNITSVYDNFGKSLPDETTEKRIINPDLLVIEYPKHSIKEGDTWTAQKSAKPDFIFKSIKTNYTLKKIQSNNNIINVTMTFEKESNNDPMLNSMTKFYTGDYTVYDDGTVKNATITITGFSGFSNLTGRLIIEEIK